MKIRALTISEVNSYIKRILINDPILYNLKVKGEISNFKIHSSGNIYFSLKDENSKINCVMFKNQYNKQLKLDNGIKVVVNGYISVYERDGAYQLYLNEIEVDGIGNLYIEFNKLKEKLSSEGLFDYKNKKQIPKMPKTIGVITSETGAVIKDIINVIKRRYPKVDIKLYSVTVQGDKSKYDICEGIEFFNNLKDIDTIIIARGGGSIEELWSFNEEIVARAIFNSEIPIISAVGHETDYTICDFVSDMRAPTPSAAAEIATPSLEDINYRLKNVGNRINTSLDNILNLNKHKLDNIFSKVNNYIYSYTIRDKIIQLDRIYDKISFESENNINIKSEQLSRQGARLHSLSPLATLDRGYSVIQKNSQIVNNVKDIKTKDILDIVLKDGNVECEVLKIKGEEV